MDIDLPYILFWVVVACAAIWLVDVVFFRSKRRAADAEAKDPAIVEYAQSFFPVLLFVLVLRSFVAEPYQIPSESMVPTLLVGDFILVNKYSYGLRLPVFGTKIVDIGEPERGDVMVFVPPHDPRYFIKRVVGIPGDRVVYENKILYINGQRLEYKLVEADPSLCTRGRLCEYVETLDGRSHSILKHRGGERTRTWEIPPGKYLMLGDNRDRSQDSRLWGLASEENIVGKAVAIWMHKDPGFNLPNFQRNRWFE